MSFRVNSGARERGKDKSQRHNKLTINNNKTYRSAGEGEGKTLGKLRFQLLN